jgi:muramidase (phage lysozyme)
MPPGPLPLLALLLPLAVHAGAARGEAVGLLGGATLFAPARPLAATPARALIGTRPTEGVRRGASLFAGREGGSLFAPLAPRIEAARLEAPAQPAGLALSGSRVERLRQIIGHAESRRHGYDAVQYGARIKPAKRPTEMTIGEIYAWIDATPRQPHAIGKFQFIPPTLRRLVRRVGLSETTLFSPPVQDRLADELLLEAGLRAATAGEIGRHSFMENLAKIWAGLPTSNGKSYYHGYAGNKASMTWAEYDREMAQLFPGRG